MKKSLEQFAEQMHIWYLEASAKLHPESYNLAAQKAYADLTEEQKFLDRYIAEKTLKAFGGCLKCYGKGYGTSLEHTQSFEDFGGEKTGYSELPLIRYCECERGKQLKSLPQEDHRGLIEWIEKERAVVTGVGSEYARGHIEFADSLLAFLSSK